MYATKMCLETVISEYEAFYIRKLGTKYRFRIIGAMGESIPIRVSIENHNFSVISVDSIDIVPVHNLTALWITVGERYDIVINTKTEDMKLHTFGEKAAFIRRTMKHTSNKFDYAIEYQEDGVPTIKTVARQDFGRMFRESLKKSPSRSETPQ